MPEEINCDQSARGYSRETDAKAKKTRKSQVKWMTKSPTKK